jgi:hypothetical protein
VVEDFSVEGDPQIAIESGHRLPPAGKVYDAEAGVGEAKGPIGDDPRLIWSTVAEVPSHPVKQIFRNGAPVKIQNTDDATHDSLNPNRKSHQHRREGIHFKQIG